MSLSLKNCGTQCVSNKLTFESHWEFPTCTDPPLALPIMLFYWGQTETYKTRSQEEQRITFIWLPKTILVVVCHVLAYRTSPRSSLTVQLQIGLQVKALQKKMNSNENSINVKQQIYIYKARILFRAWIVVAWDRGYFAQFDFTQFPLGNPNTHLHKYVRENLKKKKKYCQYFYHFVVKTSKTRKIYPRRKTT